MSEQPTTPQRFPRTPMEAIESLLEEKVIIEDRTFLIARPDHSDRLLENPDVLAEFQRDEYMPYWADLWPAARMLAKAILREPWPAGTRALEIGCGLGLPGVAALARGLHVTFSDYDLTALEFAARNARRNDFENFALLPLDWRHPPEGVTFPLVLGSDLIYEIRNVAPLVDLIKRLLAPAGVCLLTDQDRVPSHVLRQTLAEQGMTFTTKIMHAGEPGGRRVRGSLYRITLGSS